MTNPQNLLDLERHPAARPYDESGYNLERFRAQLAASGIRHDGVPWIHVAGTKGKGSTCALIESLLRSAGLKTGLFSSPHLRHVGERYRLEGAALDPASFDLAAAALTRRMPGETDPDLAGARTWFETLTALAFDLFDREHCQAGILEVGLGGRLDCTNVVTPVVSVIAALGLDHTHLLGSTPEAIAREKGGIIKPGVPVVLAQPRTPFQREARVILEQLASERCAPILEPVPVTLMHDMGPADGRIVEFPWGRDRGRGVLALAGEHQIDNLGLALTAVEVFLAKAGVELDAAGAGRAVGAAHWPGRFEVVRWQPLGVLDGAHCPLSAGALGRTLRFAMPESTPVHLIWGMQEEKDHEGFLGELLAAWGRERLDRITCMTLGGPRGAHGEQLSAAAARHGVIVRVVEGWKDVVSDPREAVVVTGSLYHLASGRDWLVGGVES